MAIKLTTRGISLVVATLVPLLCLAVWCGVLKQEVNHNKTEIVRLEAVVIMKDLALQSEIDKKVDIETFNAVTSNVHNSIEQMREDNLREHDQIQQSIISIDGKIDRLIERGD